MQHHRNISQTRKYTNVNRNLSMLYKAQHNKKTKSYYYTRIKFTLYFDIIY